MLFSIKSRKILLKIVLTIYLYYLLLVNRQIMFNSWVKNIPEPGVSGQALVIDEDGSKNNWGHARLTGVEMEIEAQLVPNFLKLNSNLSYVNARDIKNDCEFAESPNWLANIILMGLHI